MLSVQALLCEVPVRSPPRVATGLSPVDAAGGGGRNRQVTARSKEADHPDPRPHRSSGSLGTRTAPHHQRRHRHARIDGPQVDGEDGRSWPPNGCCRPTPRPVSPPGSRNGRRWPPPARAGEAGRGRRLPHLPGRVPEPGDRPGSGQGVRAQRRQCTSVDGAGCCGAPWLHSGELEAFEKQAGKNVVLAAAVRRARTSSSPSPPAGTCQAGLRRLLGGPDARVGGRAHL